MKKLTWLLILLALAMLLAACNATSNGSDETAPAGNAGAGAGTGMGMGMGMGGSMMARHHAPIPDEYAGLTNPVTADAASLARGGEIYATHCATCHGDGGNGDGPGGATLDPAPVAIAHTSQMLGDDYLFWRVSEGGAMPPFNSGMIAWKGILEEETRWDVINYVRALGSGRATPGSQMGGTAYDPAAELAQRAAMLATAVAQGVITQAEADTFTLVHAGIDEYAAGAERERTGGMQNMRTTALAALVAAGQISQAQADQFNDVHDRLLAAGLMQ